MKILVLNWRDPDNPKSGGAEQATLEIFSRIAANSHEITWFTCAYSGAEPEESKYGIRFIRRGRQSTVHFRAWRWYRKQAKAGVKFDAVVDEINTIPFFTPFYVRVPRVMYIHQLAREVWDYEARFPLDLIGRMFESLYLKPYRKEEVATVSESTRKDLLGLGFLKDRIHIIQNGCSILPVPDIESAEKVSRFTLLYFGALRPMKRVEEAIKVLDRVKEIMPDARLWIAGSGDIRYQKKLEGLVRKLSLRKSVEFLGHVSEKDKAKLMRRAHFLLATSVREGWGLVVIEANACGTPAAVYDVPGLRDSVIDGVTGIVSPDNASQNLAVRLVDVYQQPELYEKIRARAYERSKMYDWNQAADAFYLLLRDRRGSQSGEES